MNKKFVNLMLSATIGFACAASASAASDCVVDAVSAPGKVIVSGTLDPAAEGKYISLQILPENVVFEYIYDNPRDESWMYCDQIISGENGAFSTEIDSMAPTGNYIAYLSVHGELIKRPFAFANRWDNEHAMELLLAATGDAANFAQVANANAAALLLENSCSGSISTGTPLEWLRAYVNDPANSITKADGGKVAEQFETFCFIEALNENKVPSFAAGLKSSYINDQNIMTWYDKYKDTEEAETYIRGRMSGKNFTSQAQFENALIESVILYTVYKPNGTDNIKNILAQFESKTGIATAGISNNVYAALSGNKYDDYAALKAAITASSSATSSPSGPSGNSGNSGNSGGTVSLPWPSEEPKPLKTFEDLAGYDWAYEAIVNLATDGVISGINAEEYQPGANLTREQCVKLLVAIAGLEYSGYEAIFDDVKENDWFAPSVITAYKYDLCDGIGGGLFGKGMNITRQDIAVLIQNLLEGAGVEADGTVKPFDDESEISGYARDAVNYVRMLGIMNGKGGNKFDPKAPATRAEAAVVIYATRKLLK